MTYPPDGDDPWYWRMLYYPGTTGYGPTADLKFTVQNVAPAAGPATVSVDVWGRSFMDGGPDHKVDVLLSGQLVAGGHTFDGNTSYQVLAEAATSLLIDGENTLTVKLPGSVQRYDLVMLEQFTVQYPRKFVAYEGGSLVFRAAGDLSSGLSV